MATAYQNLSSCDNNTVPHSPLLRVAIVCAEWNADITDKLLAPGNIMCQWVYAASGTYLY